MGTERLMKSAYLVRPDLRCEGSGPSQEASLKPELHLETKKPQNIAAARVFEMNHFQKHVKNLHTVGFGAGHNSSKTLQ